MFISNDIFSHRQPAVVLNNRLSKFSNANKRKEVNMSIGSIMLFN